MPKNRAMYLILMIIFSLSCVSCSPPVLPTADKDNLSEYSYVSYYNDTTYIIDENGHVKNKISGYSFDFMVSRLATDYNVMYKTTDGFIDLENDRYYCDRDGRKLFDLDDEQYQVLWLNFHAGALSQTIYPVQDEKNNLCGFIDDNGVIQIKPQYKLAFPFLNGYAKVKSKDDTWGLIDINNKYLCTGYKDVSFLRTDGIYIAVDMDGFSHIRNIKGETLFSAKDIYIDLSVADKLLRYKENTKYGFMNLHGNKVIEAKYKSASYFTQGLAAVENENGKFGYIDDKGNTVIDFIYDYAVQFTPMGLATVMIGDKWGYINKAGEMVIPLSYDAAHYFYNEYAVVGKNFKGEDGKDVVKYAYIDVNGHLLTGFIFYEARAFDGPLAPVRTFVFDNEKLVPTYEYINRNGEIVFSLKKLK